MFHFFHGNRIDRLGDRLIGALSASPLPDPMQPEIIVVQNHGMARWLSLRYARRQGIAANMKFLFPSELVWYLIRLTDSDIPETLPSDRGPMTWSIMNILLEEEHELLQPLRNYIESSPENRIFRSWKLAGRIADVFDQYLVYRPDMLLGWENGSLSTGEPSEKWQQYLWNRLIETWEKGQLPAQHLHRARLQQELLVRIGEGSLPDEDLPGRVSIFGVSSLPPAFLDMIGAFSTLREVYYYWLSPNREAMEQQPSEPLLKSLGREGREFLYCLNSMGERQKGVDIQTNFVDEEEPVGGATVLGALQNSITNTPADGGSVSVDPSDASIQIHSCHSAFREVEVLHDRLLDLFERDEELQPEDILIMTPDIESYAPIIDSVFGNPESGLPEIPYSIADQSVQSTHPSVRIFLRILELADSRFKISDVLDILDSAAIKRKFDLSEDDIGVLERWLDENRIHWGIDGEFRREEGLPPDNSFTWRSGMERMVMGYAVYAGDELIDGIYPYGEVEGRDLSELVGRFASLMDRLFALRRQSRTQRKPSGWLTLLKQVVNQFIPDQSEFYRDRSEITRVLEQLAAGMEAAGKLPEVPFSVINQDLRERLEAHSTGGGFLGKGVTFSTLVPMRSIPFRCIGMIGMNDGAFPRSRINAEFDLMARQHRAGDRSRRNDDRYLFLENLISAERYLYISYLGRSNRRDTEFPPSVVVNELVGRLTEITGLEAGDWIMEHRLQSYSRTYFDRESDAELFSYSAEQREVADTLADDETGAPLFLENPLPDPGEEAKHLSMAELISFFRHPSRYLIRERLDLYMGDEERYWEDREPFRLEGLERYRLEQELLDRHLEDRSIDNFYEIAVATDLIPGGWTGRREFDQRSRIAGQFANSVRPLLDQKKLDPLEFTFTFSDFVLAGRLDRIYKNSRILYRYGRVKANTRLEAWIGHLFLQLAAPDGYPRRTLVLGRDKNNNVISERLGPVDDAKHRLSMLLRMYERGLKERTWFLPESSYAYAEELFVKGSTPEKARGRAQNRWQNPYISYPFEGDDPYNKQLYRSHNPLEYKEFEDVSKVIWEPWFNALKEES